jgi:hypothetical protein
MQKSRYSGTSKVRHQSFDFGFDLLACLAKAETLDFLKLPFPTSNHSSENFISPVFHLYLHFDYINKYFYMCNNYFIKF